MYIFWKLNSQVLRKMKYNVVKLLKIRKELKKLKKNEKNKIKRTIKKEAI